jgi:NAD(P)-dependent dehydrogenase (short-subunit alcohol dehydrogenase family)
LYLNEGCDSGFGYDTALALHQRGCTIFAGCLSREGGEKLKVRITRVANKILLRFKIACKNSARLNVVLVNLLEADSVAKAADEIEKVCAKQNLGKIFVSLHKFLNFIPRIMGTGKQCGHSDSGRDRAVVDGRVRTVVCN